ncbi:MAG TPA: integration host factor subunit beta [Dissulfuribacter thermophilus]|uniref:Integration host factor subunit beta n=1 Tax=Dissulfuribacter thermophilus TaxID=1156395 RepID=A0A7V2WT07_9BACT|nr:integration host factor subunit beta [Dissulfuribacter thermophilus]
MPLKKDVVKRMHEELPHHLKKDLEESCDIILKSMIRALGEGGRVEIRGFGCLSVRRQAGKTFKNPKTGTIHNIPPRRRIIFKPGKDLRELT